MQGVWDAEEEARAVGDEIEDLQRARPSAARRWRCWCAPSFQMREFEERFLTLGIPYRVIGGPRFYERRKSATRWPICALIAQRDDDLAFERIINTPKRGIGDATCRRCTHSRAPAAFRCSAPRATSPRPTKCKPKARKALRRSRRRFRALARAARQHAAHRSWREIVLDESGYTEMWKDDKSPEAPGRLENLKELVRAMEQFESCARFSSMSRW